MVGNMLELPAQKRYKYINFVESGGRGLREMSDHFRNDIDKNHKWSNCGICQSEFKAQIYKMVEMWENQSSK